MLLTEAARSRLIERFGPSVADWCDDFDELAEAIMKERRLRAVEVLPAGGTSVVVLCEQGDGARVVLKVTPDPRIAAEEAAALSAWAASGHVVSLAGTDAARGALLLEWLPNARRLSDVGWSLDEVIPFWPSSDGLSWRTKRCFRGDLRPGNVLRVGDGAGRIVAIDPRPCIGDPAFDLVDWALVDVTTAIALEQRIERLCDAVPGGDRSRSWAWCEARRPSGGRPAEARRRHPSHAVPAPPGRRRKVKLQKWFGSASP